ncbi:hypothetical protein ACH35V_02445 [Actinomadura sp. 1N219]|uniref:hypothetical protein n=1 Tax=Actinomadura sp. 1N219 TaxID=3375152 RepID=UPI0037918FEE
MRRSGKLLALVAFGGSALCLAVIPAEAAARDGRNCRDFRPDGALAAGGQAAGGQVAKERLAARLVADGEVQAAARALVPVFKNDPQGRTPSGAATLHSAIGNTALAAAQYALTEDGARPSFMWTVNAAHCWFGQKVNGSGYGIDNPDSVYRQTAIDGSSRYVIRGKFNGPAPVDTSLVLYGEIPGTGEVRKEGAPVLGGLTSDQMRIAPDGSFEITVGPDPAGGPNHIQTTSEAKLLIVRDTLSDWSTQNPPALSISRVDGPAPEPQPDEKALARRTAELLKAIAPYWLKYNNTYYYQYPANRISSPRSRPGALGLATSGRFSLRNDQALVVTVDRLKGRHLGFQVTDPWGVARDYPTRTSSLNSDQVRPETGETATFVISARDPGVWNWLDTSGLTSGLMAVRWRGVPAGADTDGAIRSVQVTDLKDLRDHLPAGTVFTDRRERHAQQEARAADYERRLTT